jgi:hypothetical protein
MASTKIYNAILTILLLIIGILIYLCVNLLLRNNDIVKLKDALKRRITGGV